MNFLLQLVLLACIVISPLGSAITNILEDLDKRQILYKDQVDIIYKLLVSECVEAIASETDINNTLKEPEIKRLPYNDLLQLLVKCRKRRGGSAALATALTTALTPTETSASSTTRRPLITPKSTKRLSTGFPTTRATRNPLTEATARPPATISTFRPPPDCRLAKSLTEEWRTHHAGVTIKPNGSHSAIGWACDFHKDLQWFRFSGSAGENIGQFTLNVLGTFC